MQEDQVQSKKEKALFNLMNIDKKRNRQRNLMSNKNQVAARKKLLGHDEFMDKKVAYLTSMQQQAAEINKRNG